MRPQAYGQLQYPLHRLVDYPVRDALGRLARSIDARGRGAQVSVGARERLLWVAVGCALVADLATTVAGLRAGLAEGNPAMRLALATGGVGALAAVKVAALGVGWGVRWLRPRYGTAAALALAGAWGLASVANAATLLAVR